MILRALILVLTILSLLGCQSSKFPIVEKDGIYELITTSYKMEVGIKNDLVVVSLIDSGGRMIVQNDHASALQDWSIYWDEPRKLLWFASVDVGFTIWDFSGGKEPVEAGLFGRPDLKEIVPPSLRRFL